MPCTFLTQLSFKVMNHVNMLNISHGSWGLELKAVNTKMMCFFITLKVFVQCQGKE